MFNDISNKIIERLKIKFSLDPTILHEMCDIIEEEISFIKTIADEKTELLELNTEDFHLIQFPIGKVSARSLESNLRKLSEQINYGLDYKRNFVFAYGDEKIKIDTLVKNKAYIFKIPIACMFKAQIDCMLEDYTNRIAKPLNEKGYDITFVADA
jgi:hypothetical protein